MAKHRKDPPSRRDKARQDAVSSTTTSTSLTTTGAPIEWYEPEKEDIPTRMKKDLGRIGKARAIESLAVMGPDVLAFWLSCPDCPQAHTVFAAIRTQWSLLCRRNGYHHVDALPTDMDEAFHVMVRFQQTGGSVHSDDFHSVRWYGQEFVFTHQQAAVVTLLWQAWEQGTPDLGQEYLLEHSGSESSRLRDVFKETRGMHPAWGTIVVESKRGVYRLQERTENP